MISVEEAHDSIRNSIPRLAPREFNLENSTGLVLAEEPVSGIDMPPFDQSAMDGYAFKHTPDIQSGSRLKIVGEVQAGHDEETHLTAGEAYRIFTGAPIPAGADTVIMQEHTETSGDELIINTVPQAGANVRKQGEQIKEGERPLKKGTVIGPAQMALIATLGIDTFKAYPKPRVGIVVTGNELVKPGTSLPMGGIYESNSYMLKSCLDSIGIDNHVYHRVPDEYEEVKRFIEQGLSEFDMLLVSGGISVGDYDFVGRALEELGVEKVFHKIKQKPGKPVYFGKKGETAVFGLPGNPASSLVCYYEYVYPAIRLMSGWKNPYLKKLKLPVAEGYSKRAGRAEFLKAKVEQGVVHILDGQSSAMIRSFASADALIYLPEDCTQININDLVEVHVVNDFA